MGGCASKSGEATFDDDLKPYDRGSKKRSSSRKSKKAQKQASTEVELRTPQERVDKHLEVLEEVLVRRNSLYDNGREVDVTPPPERPVPVPRARSRENLVSAHDYFNILI